MFEVFSKLITNTSERRQNRRSGVFLAKCRAYFTPFSSVNIIDTEQLFHICCI